MSSKHPTRITQIAISSLLLFTLSTLVVASTMFFQNILRSLGPTRQDLTAELITKRNQPIRIATTDRQFTLNSSWSTRRLRSLVQLPSTSPPSLGDALHVLHLHGMGAPLDHPKISTTDYLVQILTDSSASQRLMGSSTIVKTPHGARVPTLHRPFPRDPQTQESHRDQCLATLAELGVPLDYPLVIESHSLTVRDLLRDSIANFHLRQEELNWTAVAYAFYLPPIRQWRNRYGECHTFDELAKELMSRPLQSASCAGTHLLTSLTTLYMADEATPILSPSVRSSLYTYLLSYLSLVIANQHQDGFWQIDWHNIIHNTTSHTAIAYNELTKLTATGHLTEWLISLPTVFPIPPDTVQRAGRWLESQVVQADEITIRQAFCPYTHAITALVRLQEGGPIHE